MSGQSPQVRSGDRWIGGVALIAGICGGLSSGITMALAVSDRLAPTRTIIRGDPTPYSLLPTPDWMWWASGGVAAIAGGSVGVLAAMLLWFGVIVALLFGREFIKRIRIESANLDREAKTAARERIDDVIPFDPDVVSAPQNGETPKPRVSHWPED